MPQVNSSPGAFPAAGSNVVSPGALQINSSIPRAAAVLTTVSYVQNEPGAGNPNRPQRS